MRAEGAVGGLEQVMALIEDVAQWPRGVVEAAHRRLHHHQRVVGDDDVGLPRAADRAFDIAFPIVFAGRIDALAAPVGQPLHAAAAHQVEQPGRQVAADHVAVAAGQRPARHQAETDRILRHQAGAHRRLLEIQQAQIVLATLADDDAATLLRRVAMQPVEFVVDLALQVARVGRDPDRGAVLLGPQAGGRDIAQGLADAGAGLDQHDMGFAFLLARRKGCAGGRGIVALGRPGLGHVGAGRDEMGQAQSRFARFDGLAAWRRCGRRLFPYGQALPDIEARAGAGFAAPFIDAERVQHRIAPAPSATGHGQRRFLHFGRSEGSHVVELVEQRARELGQGGHLLLGRRGDFEAERLAQAAHGRQAEARRSHEGEEFEQVVCRKVFEPKPRRDRGRVADQRQGAGRPTPCIGTRQPFRRSVRRAP